MKEQIAEFHNYLQNLSDKKINGLEEICDILVMLIPKEKFNNPQRIINKTTQFVNFKSQEEVHEFLDKYFSFQNSLILYIETIMQIMDEKKFSLRIEELVTSCIDTLPLEESRKILIEFIDNIFQTVLKEYNIRLKENDESAKSVKKVTNALHSEELAILFFSLLRSIEVLEKSETLSKEEIIETSAPAFVFALCMNQLRQSLLHDKMASANNPEYNVGRNDPCPCGSGKKYKKCCLNNPKKIANANEEQNEIEEIEESSLVKKREEQVFQIKISIKGAKPPIWRKVLLSSHTTFQELHEMIQTLFSWEDCHLFEFVGENSYSNDEEMPDVLKTTAHTIDEELFEEKDKMMYIYDFGDDWVHEIILEKILPFEEELALPKYVTGRRRGPIEDCGGIPIYNEIVEAIEKPTLDNQTILKEFGLEGFDPKNFDKKEFGF